MPLRLHTPRPPLCEFVEVMCLCEDYRPVHAKERILPDGRMALIVNLREDRLRLYDSDEPHRFETTRGSLVSGAQTRFHVIDTACQEFIVTVHFKPGGAFPFLGLPADELCNNHVTLEDAWGADGNKLRGRLQEAHTPAERFALLEQALLERMRRSTPRHPAVAFALREFQRQPQPPSVAGVVEQTGLSQRRFIQLFSAEAGLTPKLFCRLRRFRQALDAAGRKGCVDWAAVALDCGYYDQAHFIHDFREFSGLNPTAWLPLRGEHVNHVPLDC